MTKEVDDIEISRIMVTTKKKLMIAKNDVAVYVVDIPEVVRILKERYKITKR